MGVLAGVAERAEHELAQPAGTVPGHRRLPVGAAGQAGEHVGYIADQLHLGNEELVNLGVDAVDHDDLLVAARVPVLRRVLDQVVADRDHQVRVLEPGHLVVAGLQTDRPKGFGIVEVEEALGHEGLGHRDAGRLCERAQRPTGAAADGAVAGQRDRALGVVDQIGGALELAHPRLGPHK